jgi:hypothetical protein
VRCHCPTAWSLARPLNLTYLRSSLETLIRDRSLYVLLTFHVPNPLSIFRRLARISTERGWYEYSVTSYFFKMRGCSPTPNPQTGGSTLVIFRGCLSNIFTTTLLSWRPSLHPQLEVLWWQGEPLNIGSHMHTRDNTICKREIYHCLCARRGCNSQKSLSVSALRERKECEDERAVFCFGASCLFRG